MSDRPQPAEYPPFYSGYVASVPEGDVLELLAAQPARLARLVESLDPERERFRYAPEKWSVREVFGHLIDAERVFGYRAFRIGRGDATPLAGFDEKLYVAAGGYDEISLAESVAEFTRARLANLDVLRRVLPAGAARSGIANDAPVSLGALAFILAGHVEHHVRGLAERYGVGG